jgi:hypothetical protein
MSVQAVTWAFDQQIRPAGTKLVLIALADYCGEENVAFPSITTLTRKTTQDWRTVTRALDSLEKLGLIVDSGERRGATKQIKVYQLNLKTVNLTGLKTVRDVGKDCQPCVQNRKGTVQEYPLPPKLVSLQKDWEEYLHHRKEIGASMTKLSYQKIMAKFERWGLEGSRAAIQLAIENGWQGLFEPRDFQKKRKQREDAERSHQIRLRAMPSPPPMSDEQIERNRQVVKSEMSKLRKQLRIRDLSEEFNRQEK